jgi:16S rRNA (adenine1518-N6/adenine1519-N6)-dimethyltransferase
MKLYKSKGQHILKNEKIAFKMARYARVSSSDVVLEIGCGTGILTRALLSRGARVVGIEIDSRFIELLKKKFSKEIESSRLKLICGDALKIEFPYFNKLVSNIPYTISTPLTFKLLEYEFDVAVVMYQKEFAERLTATRGKNYGKISVIVRAFATPKLVEIVDRRNFYPVPKVDSAIVLLKREPEIEADVCALKEFVRVCFNNRRKKLGKILKKFGLPDSIVQEYGNKRAEEIRPQEYAEIVGVLHTR